LLNFRGDGERDFFELTVARISEETIPLGSRDDQGNGPFLKGKSMIRKVYYSFYYKGDSSRVQQVINMGAVEGQPLLTGQKWEEVEKGGDAGIEKWINDEMKNKTCLVVLVGTLTSTRPWVQYEIKKAWKDGLGVLGVNIHGLRDLNSQSTSNKGKKPFDGLNLNGTAFSSIVTLFDPVGTNSKAVYASINDNLEKLVEAAIKIRAKY
jgi:hypothetical protein